MKVHLFCQIRLYEMPERHLKESRENFECTLSWNWDMKPPFMMVLALELTLKGVLKVYFRLISPLMKSSLVLDSL